MCHFTPYGLCPSGVIPRVTKAHQWISSSKQVTDIIDGLGLMRLYCSCFTGRKNGAQVLIWDDKSLSALTGACSKSKG